MAYMKKEKLSYDKRSYLDIANEEITIGPVISQNMSKILDDCVRSLVVNAPPNRKEKNEIRVRRPMNAFMIYSQTARKVVAKTYPNLSYRKLSKALGKIWGVLSPEEKKPFEKEAERLRRIHKQKHPDHMFNSSRLRKPKEEKTTANCHFLPSMHDLWSLIQDQRRSSSSEQIRGEIGNNRYMGVTEGTGFHGTLESQQCQSNPKNYLNSRSNFLEGPRAPWTTFGYYGQNLHGCVKQSSCGYQSADITSFEDQILPIIDNDTLATSMQPYECNTNITLKTQHENQAISVGFPSDFSFNFNSSNGYTPLVKLNNGLLTSFGDDDGETAFPNAMDHFNNFVEDDRFRSTSPTTSLYSPVLDNFHN